MSWWDTSQLTSFASSAIKNAQKKIDKVLDIPVEDDTDGAVTDFSKPKLDEKKAANSTWSAWGTPSFLPSTPKSSSFNEPSADRVSPSLRAESPKPLKSDRSSSPRNSPGAEGEAGSLLKDEPIAASSPTVRTDKHSERRQARRQKSHEKAPSAPKKLGATKLGAVKVKKTDSNADALPSGNQEFVKLQADPADPPSTTEISQIVNVSELSVGNISTPATYADYTSLVASADSTSNPVASADNTSNLAASADDTSNPVVSADSTSNPVASADNTSNPVVSADNTSIPVASADDTSNPVVSAENTSIPVASADSTSNPVASADSTSNPTASADNTSNPAASADNTSNPAASADSTSTSAASVVNTSNFTVYAENDSTLAASAKGTSNLKRADIDTDIKDEITGETLATDSNIISSNRKPSLPESRPIAERIILSNADGTSQLTTKEVKLSTSVSANSEAFPSSSVESREDAVITHDIPLGTIQGTGLLGDKDSMTSDGLIKTQTDQSSRNKMSESSSELLLKSVDSDMILVGVDDYSVDPFTIDNSTVDSPAIDTSTVNISTVDNSMDDTMIQTGHIPENNQSDLGGMNENTGLSVTGAEIITKSGSSDGTVTDQVTDPQTQQEDGDLAAPAAEDELEEGTQMTDSMTPSLMDQSVSSDNSYVKCELTSSYLYNVHDSGSNFRDIRAPSEFSDFETATSSDIEIISMASTYGDGNGDSRMVDDFMPLGRSVFKTKMRDISPDDISISSSQVSPSSGSEDMITVTDVTAESSVPNPQPAAVADPNNPLDSTTLLKKLSQVTEILEVRETKLLSMSREHGELLEVNAHLKRRIEQMEETNGDLDLVKDEFGQRLHELERKLQQSLREKELVKKQLMTTQEELHNRAGTSGKMQRMVEEKDEQITSLMVEGEKLAKQQLQSNNLIKKLRKKEKEQEELSRAQREKIDYQNSELERLKNVLDSKNQNETKHSELIKQLNSAVSIYQTENQRLKSDMEEALEKQKRAESAVDNSYKEIAELHKSVAAKETKLRELALGNEAHMKEELQMALEKKHKEALRDADHLTNQIEDMQLTINRMENEQHRREECLRQEQRDLLEKLEKSDKRNDELTHTVSAATRPLLRQIENLQASYSAQSSSWEKLERNLTDRLAEAQNQLAAATEKERLSSESSMELSSRINVLETQLSSLKQEKSKLTAELEMCKIKLSTLQDERNSSTAQLETYKSNIESDRIETKKSQTLLENKLDLERSKLEAEKKKCLALMEQLSEKEQQIHELNVNRVRSTPSPSSVGEDTKATPVMRRSMKQDELLERALSTSTIMGSSLYDNMRNHGTTSLLENLESQVKQREGEIVQLQADIVEHEKTRESLTKEMVKLTEENSTHENRIRQLSKVQQQYKELNGRYQALLQMYGEKEEQVNELRLDLVDVKQMYKQQIDALLSK